MLSTIWTTRSWRFLVLQNFKCCLCFECPGEWSPKARTQLLLSMTWPWRWYSPRLSESQSTTAIVSLFLKLYVNQRLSCCCHCDLTLKMISPVLIRTLRTTNQCIKILLRYISYSLIQTINFPLLFEFLYWTLWWLLILFYSFNWIGGGFS